MTCIRIPYSNQGKFELPMTFCFGSKSASLSIYRGGINERDEECIVIVILEDSMSSLVEVVKKIELPETYSSKL